MKLQALTTLLACTLLASCGKAYVDYSNSSLSNCVEVAESVITLSSNQSFIRIECPGEPPLRCVKYDRGISCDWHSYNRKQRQAELSTVMSCVRTAEGNVKTESEFPCLGFGD